MTIIQIAETVHPMTPQDRNSVLLWLGVLLLVVIAGFVAILLLRRKLRIEQSNDAHSDGGFLLSDLRKMRDNGEITPEEYEMTRAKVVARIKAKTADIKTPKPKQNPNAAPPNLEDPNPQ